MDDQPLVLMQLRASVRHCVAICACARRRRKPDVVRPQAASQHVQHVVRNPPGAGWLPAQARASSSTLPVVVMLRQQASPSMLSMCRWRYGKRRSPLGSVFWLLVGDRL